MTLHKFLEHLAAQGFYTPPDDGPATNGHHPPGPAPDPGDPQSSRYAHAALISESHKVAVRPEGVRNAELVRSAYRMGQIAAGGYLDQMDVVEELLRAAQASGLPTAEARATILSGLRAGMGAPRVLALRTEVAPAYTLTEQPAGELSPLSPAVPAQVSEGEQDPLGDSGDSGLPRDMDWEHLWANVAVEPDWLIADVLERGRSHVLYAPHKIGKSLITLSWCGQLAKHGEHVLYIDFENSPADIVERLQDMGYQPADLATLHYLSFPTMAALDTPMGGATLAALVADRAATLVVLDTTARVVIGKENESDTYRNLYRHALVPLKAAGVTTLRIDHAGKDITAGQRGSSAKGDDVDVVWLLTRADDIRYTLRCDAQRSGHHPQIVEFRRRDDPLLCFERLSGDPFSQPEVTVVVDHLDRLQVPVSAGRPQAREALAKAGIKVRNDALAKALRVRKIPPTYWDEVSGTAVPELIKPEINNDCPQDQLVIPITADESCPGQLGDSGDSGTGVPQGRAVPTCPPLSGGQGTDRPGPPPDQTRHECPKCHQVVDHVRTLTHGRWPYLCVPCAYPDPSNRPGAEIDEEEN